MGWGVNLNLCADVHNIFYSLLFIWFEDYNSGLEFGKKPKEKNAIRKLHLYVFF